VLTYPNGVEIAASATTASTVNYTIDGMEIPTGANPTPVPIKQQGQCASSAAQIYTPSGSNSAMISSIHFYNTSTTLTQTVNVYSGGTAGTNQEAVLVIPPGGWAHYEDGSPWYVYNSSGLIVTGSSLLLGSVGTPSSSTTALTASTRIVIGGSLFSVPTNGLAVGQVYQWTIGIIKTTAAGAATWTAIVSIGSTGTNSDPSVATFTSGTNTGAVDQAILVITCRITGLGSSTSATAACNAAYCNTLTNATGLGTIPMIPGATAGFDSTVTTPNLHIDITMGASAVCTSVCSAERIA
jgi:hypothetical protein